MWGIDKERFSKFPVDIFVLEFSWLEEFAGYTAMRLTNNKAIILLFYHFVLDQNLGFDRKKPGIQSNNLCYFIDIMFGNL